MHISVKEGNDGHLCEVIVSIISDDQLSEFPSSSLSVWDGYPYEDESPCVRMNLRAMGSDQLDVARQVRRCIQ